MEELMQNMADKVGIDRATADEVVAFLKLPGARGDKLGGLR